MTNDKPARFYGVAVGRKPGVYTDWPKAQEAIVGWKGPKYKKFDTRTEAEAFVRSYGTAATAARLASDSDLVNDSEEPPAKKAKKAAVHPPSRSNVDVVYTDGSSLGNGRAGASAGVGVYFGDSDPR
jgi:ribonuclease HI